MTQDFSALKSAVHHLDNKGPRLIEVIYALNKVYSWRSSGISEYISGHLLDTETKWVGLYRALVIIFLHYFLRSSSVSLCNSALQKCALFRDAGLEVVALKKISYGSA